MSLSMVIVSYLCVTHTECLTLQSDVSRIAGGPRLRQARKIPTLDRSPATGV